MAIRYNLKVDQGQQYDKTVERELPVLDAGGNPVLDVNNKPTYQPADMTGWTGHMQVRVEPEDTAVMLNLTEDPAGVDGHLTFGNGWFAILINQDRVAMLREGWAYDVLAGPVGVPLKKLMYGLIEIESKGVTR